MTTPEVSVSWDQDRIAAVLNSLGHGTHRVHVRHVYHAEQIAHVQKVADTIGCDVRWRVYPPTRIRQRTGFTIEVTW